MKTYESVFIAPPDTAPQKLDAFVDKLKSLLSAQGGETVNVDKWGRRRLSYPIDRHREGTYVHWLFKAPAPFLAELDKVYRVSDDVIRHLVCVAVRPSPQRPAAVSSSPDKQESAAATAAVTGAAPAAAASATAAVTPKEVPPHGHAPSTAPAQ